MEVLSDQHQLHKAVVQIRSDRDQMLLALHELPVCQRLFPTAANFVLMRVTNAPAIYNYLVDCGIVVRSRHRVVLCENCLRITLGTRQENSELLGALRKYKEC